MNPATPTNLTFQKNYFPALTGVRALAAWLVFVHHLPLDGKFSGPLRWFLDGSNIGVGIFFVLSGFLIAYRYEKPLEKQQISFGNYMFRRFARIYPLYLVITIFTLIWDNNFSWMAWLLNLTLLKSFFYVEIGTGIVQGWSLTVEETYYLLAPLVFLGFRKVKIATVFILIFIGIGIVFLALKAGSQNFMSDYELMMYNSFFGRCFEFYCGYLLASWVKASATKKKSTPAITTIGSLLMVGMILFVGFSQTLRYGFPFPVSIAVLVNNFLLPVVTTFWFYGLLTERSIISKMLSSTVFQVLGKSSFAFYLIHLGWFPEAIYFHIYPSMFAMFIFLNIWAIGLYYLFEKPVNHYLIKRFTARNMSASLKT